MTRLTRTLLAALLGAGAAIAQSVPNELYSTDIARKMVALANAQDPVPSRFPELTDSTGNGVYELESASTWTSSFLAAAFHSLRLRTELCPHSSDNLLMSTDWGAEVRKWSTNLLQNTHLTNTHDLGFLSWVFQDELIEAGSMDGNQTARDAVLQMAQHLADRFVPSVGCTRSWDQGGPDDVEVIIDNMMNLELLMFAHAINGNQTYVDIALSHANKTQQNHVRPDGSSYHVVDYSEATGGIVWRGTAQGYSNSSTWSRGQSWGIYGFTNLFNWTQVPAYLDVGRTMARWYIEHLPPDGVPYWDFNAPLDTNPTKDASSAMIASSAFLQLSSIEARAGNSSGATYYQNAATSLLQATVSLAWPVAESWQSLLANGTVNNRANPPSHNTGIIYADSFFIEAGNRLLQLGLANCTNGEPAVGASSTNDLSGLGGKDASSTPGQSGSRRFYASRPVWRP